MNQKVAIFFKIGIFFCNSDYVSILKIVDESYKDEEFSVHIFTEKLEHLPVIRSYKDIIILYQVKVLLEFHSYDAKLLIFGSFLCFWDFMVTF